MRVMKAFLGSAARVAFLVLLVAVLVLPGNVFGAMSDEQRQVFNLGIPYYNVDVGGNGGCVNGGDLNSSAPTDLKGETNQEKVWNYFIERGLTPIAAAGAMGNMEQESAAFDPWAVEGGNKSLDKGLLGVGFGLIQWTNTDGNHQGRRYGIMKYIEDNGLQIFSTDPADIDKGLLLELNWLWDGEYGGMTWQEKLNAETTVDGSTDPSTHGTWSDKYQRYYYTDASKQIGNGSAMLFHASVERSGDNAAGVQERIDSAKKFLEKYGNSSSPGACGEGLVSGGMTLDQAETLFAPYKNHDTAEEQYAILARTTCEGATGYNRVVWDNCTTVSAWFVAKYTTLTINGVGNGNETVDRIVSQNQALKDRASEVVGTSPRPYSVCAGRCGSNSGNHTFIILGVDEAANTMVIIEAGCRAGSGFTAAKEVNISDKISPNDKILYLEDYLKDI